MQLPTDLVESRDLLKRAARVVTAHAAKSAEHHDFGPEYVSRVSRIASYIARAQADIDALGEEESFSETSA